MSNLGPLRFDIRHSVVQLQPKAAIAAAAKGQALVPTITVDLKTGRVQVLKAQPLPQEDAKSALGVIGLLRLEGGAVLVLASKARKVCMLPQSVYKVTDTQMITHEDVKKTLKDLRLAHLLHEAMDVKTYGQHLYFSYERDLTRSVQATHQRPYPSSSDGATAGLGSVGRALLQQADPQFVTNGALLQPFLDAGADAFALPLIVGYVGQVLNPVFKRVDCSNCFSQPESRQQNECHSSDGQLQRQELNVEHQDKQDQQDRQHGLDQQHLGSACDTDAEVDAEMDPGLGFSGFQRQERTLNPDELPGHITLIARVSAQRQGTLLWRKGLDLEGNVAHLTEVEQTVVVELPGGTEQWLSHVQVRSSVPLLWSQPPDVWPTPRVRVVRDMVQQAAAFKQFVNRQLAAYGAVTLLHLPSSHRADTAVQLVLKSLVEGASVASQTHRGQAAAVPSATGQMDRQEPGLQEGVDVGNEARVAVTPQPQPGSAEAVSRPGIGPMVLGRTADGPAGSSAAPSSSSTSQGRSAAFASQLSLVVAGAGVQGLSRCSGLGLVSSASRQQRLWGQVADTVLGYGYFAAQAQMQAQGLDPCISQCTGTSLQESAGIQGGENTRSGAGASSTAQEPPGSRRGLNSRSRQGPREAGTSTETSSAARWASQPAPKLQQGVLHVSCWDTVDEAQVVQQMVALQVLERQLRGAGLMPEEQELEDAYPEVSQAMRTLWNHMGNITADQASGVGSMAGPVLRTGHLGVLTRLSNLYFMGERWFHGAFLDVRKQDALDLMSGAYKCRPDHAGLTTRSNNYSTLEVGAALTAWGLSQLYFLCAQSSWADVRIQGVVLSVLLPLVVGLGLVGAGVAMGVEQPQLCPELVAPGLDGGAGLQGQ